MLFMVAWLQTLLLKAEDSWISRKSWFLYKLAVMQ